MCGDEHARLCGENVEKMNMHVSENQMNGDADKTTASRGGRQVQGNVSDFSQKSFSQEISFYRRSSQRIFPRKVSPEDF